MKNVKWKNKYNLLHTEYNHLIDSYNDLKETNELLNNEVIKYKKYIKTKQKQVVELENKWKEYEARDLEWNELNNEWVLAEVKFTKGPFISLRLYSDKTNRTKTIRLLKETHNKFAEQLNMFHINKKIDYILYKHNLLKKEVK